MKKMLTTLCLIVLTAAALPAAALCAEEKPAVAANPVVIVVTTLGDITIELDQAKAPLTVKNFLDYADAKFFNDTVFHRVIPGFMIQGGGFTKDMQQKKTNAPIKNEAKNGLSNKRGTIAMARTAVVDSATAQFFINLSDNVFLDHGVRDYGYAVFGKVIGGMDVVDKIGKVKTGNSGRFQNVPVDPVVITAVRKK